MSTVGERIWVRRNLAGLSRTELADQIGTFSVPSGNGVLCYIETNRRPVSLDRMILIARALRCDILSLTTDGDAHHPDGRLVLVPSPRRGVWIGLDGSHRQSMALAGFGPFVRNAQLDAVREAFAAKRIGMDADPDRRISHAPTIRKPDSYPESYRVAMIRWATSQLRDKYTANEIEAFTRQYVNRQMIRDAARDMNLCLATFNLWSSITTYPAVVRCMASDDGRRHAVEIIGRMVSRKSSDNPAASTLALS